MFKFIFLSCVVMLGCVCLTNSTKLKQAEVDFLMGFAEGIKSEYGDFEKCGQACNFTTDDIEIALIMINEGLRTRTVRKVIKGFIYLSVGIDDLSLVFKECGSRELYFKLMKISYDLKNQGGLYVAFREAMIIIHNEKDFTHDFKILIIDWRLAKYRESGRNLGRILGKLIDDYGRDKFAVARVVPPEKQQQIAGDSQTAWTKV